MVNIFDSLTKHISFKSSTAAPDFHRDQRGAVKLQKEVAAKSNDAFDLHLPDTLDFFGEDTVPEASTSAAKPVEKAPKVKKSKEAVPKKTEAQNESPQPSLTAAEIKEIRKSQDIHALVMLASDASAKKLLKSRKARRRNRSGDLAGVPEVPSCVQNFAALRAHNVPQRMLDNLAVRDMTECTAVQMQAIPAMLASITGGGGIPAASIVCAPTGSGKTVAYLLPLSTFVHKTKEKAAETDALRAIVIAPTRELAMQIEREFLFLADHLGIRCMRREKSKSQTSKQDVLISTPKRILSLLAAGHIARKHFRFCVFDEFDRLFDRDSADMHRQTLEILQLIPQKEAILGLFSATIPQRLEEAFRKVYPHAYYRILIGARVSANTSVSQRMLYVRDEASKVDALRRLLTGGFKAPMLIFVHTAERCAQFAKAIDTPALRVAVLRHDMPERAKNILIEQFRLGEIFVLITTDMLARGIDFKDVGTVVNADIPLTAETYVHRVGRCGRAGGQGDAVTFFTDDDTPFIPAVVKLITEAGGEVAPYLLEMKAPGAGKLKKARIAVGKRLDLPRLG